VPSPPEGVAAHVDEPPVVREVGEAEQVPDTGGRTVMVMEAEFFTLVNAPAIPPVTVHVAT